jgi:tetratricopeptide (TPR) repeat protein
VAAVLALVLPYVPRPKDHDPTQELNAMNGAYSQGLYDDADRAADAVLTLDPQNARALNMKGIAAFYRGSYQTAAQYFSDSLNASPGDSVTEKNLVS